MMNISIILPAYNEEANLETAIDSVDSAIEFLDLNYEIIVVNDGSTDRSGEVVRDLVDRYPKLKLIEHHPNRGYGGALKAGFEAARFEWIAFLPADNQFDPNEIELLLERIDTADLVSGYRKNRQDRWIRKLNAWGWNMLVRLLFGHLCRDIDCGFKLFRKEILQHVKINSDGAMIDTELLAGAKVRGYRIADVPLTHRPRISGEATGANPIVILRAFRDLIRFRISLWHELISEWRERRIKHEMG